MTRSSRPDGLAVLVAAAVALGVLVLTAEPDAWPWGVFASLVLWGAWRLPVRTTLLAMTFFALAVDNPHERPSAGWWSNPLRPLAEPFYVNLHHQLPLPFLRISGLELLLAVVVVAVLVRQARGDDVEPRPLPSPAPLRQALVIAVLALLALEAWGLLRDGDFKQSLFQARVMLALPVVTWLFLYGLRGAADIAPLFRVVILAALVKVATSAWFIFMICRPQGLAPPYATTHSDTVLYVVALMILVARWWERPAWRTLLEAGALGGAVCLGMALNDRRLAWASLLMALAALVLVSPWNRARRFVVRATLASLPALLVYAAAGWSSTATIFKPVRDLRSLTGTSVDVDKDASTQFRDDENFNLVATWQEAPLVGAGFGHEFVEYVPLPDISRFMPTYHYQPHNGVLWLWTVGGLVGFSLLWLFLVAGVYFAARAYHRAVAPRERAAMLVALGAVLTYANQVYGDMGTQSYTCVFLVAPLLALAGQLAVATGAWRAEPAADSGALLASYLPAARAHTDWRRG